MSIDDTLFDSEKEQQDQAAVKHHLLPSASAIVTARDSYHTNTHSTAPGSYNTAASTGMVPGLYNVVETSEFFHSHESDSHVLNYSEHDYDTSHVTDPSGISDLSAVLPVDVTFSAPAQLYPPHVTPYWTQHTDHVTNHVTDQRVTPVKRRDLNEIASMKLPELKTELKRYVPQQHCHIRQSPCSTLTNISAQISLEHQGHQATARAALVPPLVLVPQSRAWSRAGQRTVHLCRTRHQRDSTALVSVT